MQKLCRATLCQVCLWGKSGVRRRAGQGISAGSEGSEKGLTRLGDVIAQLHTGSVWVRELQRAAAAWGHRTTSHHQLSGWHTWGEVFWAMQWRLALNG